MIIGMEGASSVEPGDSLKMGADGTSGMAKTLDASHELGPVMSKLCAQEDRTPSDYSRRTYDEPHDKSQDTEHTIRGTLQLTFY